MKLLKICIIGSSGHVNYVLDDIKERPDIEICGVAPGPEEEGVKGLFEKLKSLGHPVEYFDNYIEMLDIIKPEIAVVACYNGNHGKVTMDAVKRDIHIFVEKPIATSLGDLIEIEDAVNHKGIHLAAMFGIRYTNWFYTAQKLVREGAIGNVRLLNAQKSYKLGQRGVNFQDSDLYGGTIPWVGSHAIDWVYWFAGKKFKSVYAVQSSLYNNNHKSLETSALCHFTLEDEIIASVSIDYYRPSAAKTHDDDRIRVVGTKGVIEVRGKKVHLINEDNDGSSEVELLTTEGIFTDFLRVVEEKGQPIVTKEASFYVTEACLNARLSAETGKIIYF
jgi:predicted dehydrogenase